MSTEKESDDSNSPSDKVDNEDPMTYMLSQVASKDPKSPMYFLDGDTSSVQITKVVSNDSTTADKVTSSTVGGISKATGTESSGVEEDSIGSEESEEEAADKASGNEDDVDLIHLTGTSEDLVNSNFVCIGCGNCRDDCHEYLYGSWLVQETISLMNKKEPVELTENNARHRMRYEYNKHVNFACYKEVHKYNSDCWYQFLDCLEKGAVQYGIKIFKNQQFFCHLNNRREGGVVGRTMRNRATKVYDYSNIL